MLRRAARYAPKTCATYTEGLAVAGSWRRARHDDAGELYEALGVDRRATKEDIKQAFRMVRRHPDAAALMALHVCYDLPNQVFLPSLAFQTLKRRLHSCAQKAKQHHPDRHHGAARGQGTVQRAAFARILSAYQARSERTQCAHPKRGPSDVSDATHAASMRAHGMLPIDVLQTACYPPLLLLKIA